MTSRIKTFAAALLLLALSASQTIHAQAVSILGEKVIWHKVTLEFTGPQTSENATPNPFTDMRMDVSFTHASSGTTYVVPGFFAADGDAANSSATSGNKWHAYLRPNQSGTWNYSISFRQGSDVASSTTANPGSALSPYNGVNGTIQISANNTATAPDFRAKGRLRYVGKHHLQFEGTGEYFLKFGPDSPENPLEYVDFDNTPSLGYPADVDGRGKERPPAGFIKTWEAHQADYNNDGETWQNGKGSELLGAINYLASTGANSISTLLYNLWGDGRRTFPYTTTTERERFDCSKLDQWEIVFNHAEQKGLHLHFKLFENENGKIHDGGGNTLGPERRLYYREMIARFGHHLALNWNISEEINMGGEAVIEGSLKYFEDNDPWQSNRVFHTAPQASAKTNRYTQYLGDSEMTGVSLQIELSATSENVFNETKEWVDKSAAAGRPWVCANDEQGPGNLGIRASEDGTRRYALWGNIMAGGAGVEYYVGGKDLSMQDYRAELDAVLEDADITINDFFYGQNIPFWVMSNNDALITNTAAHCLTDSENSFVVYLEEGGTTNLNLSGIEGSFSVQWFDPRNGGAMQNGSVIEVDGGANRSLGTAPSSTTEDWAILVKKNASQNAGSRWLESNGYVVMEMEHTESPLGTWDLHPIYTAGTLPSVPAGDGVYLVGATGSGHLEYPGPGWAQANSPLEYKFQVTKPGVYNLHLRCFKRLDDDDEGDKRNDCFIRMAGDFTSATTIPTAALEGNIKLYGGNDHSWGRATKLDYNGGHHNAAYNFKAGETYTLTISDRSLKFNIDRIVIYHEDNGYPSNSTLANLPESTIDSGPNVDAGADKEVVLPNTSATFFGSASGDGTIVSYQWSLESGSNSAVLLDADTPYLSVSSLELGTYVFRLTATDNDGNASSDEVTLNVVGEASQPDKVAIEFTTPFTNRALNGQQDWNAEANWSVDISSGGSTSTNTDGHIAVLNQPVKLRQGETVSFELDFEFGGNYTTPTGLAYTVLAGLKATNAADSLGTASTEPDVNVQILAAAGEYRLLSNCSTVSGTSKIGNGPNAGDQLRLTYELTLGSSAADTSYTVRLQNLTDSTDTGMGTIDSISADVYAALIGDGAYMFFQRINPDANNTGLSSLKVNTFCYTIPIPVSYTDIDFVSPFTNGALNGQQDWLTSDTWTIDNTGSGHASSTANSNIAVLNSPITVAAGESFAYTIDFEFTGSFSNPTNWAYTFLTGLKANSAGDSVGTGNAEPDVNIQLIRDSNEYRLLNNYATPAGASNLAGAPNPGDQLRLYYEITLGNTAANSSYTVRLENLSDGTDSGTGTVDGYRTSGVDYSGIDPTVYSALTGSGAYLFFQQINPGANGSGLTGIKVDTVTLPGSAAELDGFEKFEEDYALLLGMYGDDDGDEVTNLLEYAFGGNPQDDTSHGRMPEILSITPGNPTVIEFEFRRLKASESGILYQVEWTDDMLVDWYDYTTSLEIDPDPESEEYELITVSVSSSEERIFLRVRVDAE